jgi:2-polyprenyl-6-methoxyphenol hydroxylase-like FAD-dependent oxidoreductase
MTLRQVLFTGMDDVVAFDKVFTHYWQHDDGTVEAFFADGSSASGDVLVAVDGANSAVCRQYLPHATVKPAGITAVGGKVPITDATKPLLPHHCFQGLSPRQAAACGDRRLRGRDGPLRVRRGGRLSSQNGSGGNDPLHKPVVGRVMLAATRTYFRAVDRIPAARRKFLNSLYTYRSS